MGIKTGIANSRAAADVKEVEKAEMGIKTGIVIPSLNQGNYIEAALRSVIANKKHTKIDLAVMDGGSKDQTVSIIRKYESQIKVWRSEPDRGQADAINKGIQALGDCQYYMWLNADDIYESEYAVKKLVGYAHQNHYEVCYGLSHFMDEGGAATGEYPVEPFDRHALGDHCYLSQPSVAFSKRAYEETGPLNKGLKMCLDYEYWIRLARKYEFGFVREYIGATRMYAQTKTATMQPLHIKEAIRILTKYYGRVPMHWAVTKFLSDHPNSLLHAMPKRLLIPLLFPWKGRILKKPASGEGQGIRKNGDHNGKLTCGRGQSLENKGKPASCAGQNSRKSSAREGQDA